MGPFSVQSKVTLSLPLPDPESRSGVVNLDADVYVPEGDGPFPVLLMRQPYGRAIASTVVYAHPSWYASHGYMVVIQDVRGRGTSGGNFRLFQHEAEDGYASVLWAAQLPKSSGQVGMYGFSYQGMTQLYAAAWQPSPLKTLIPAMAGYDLYRDKAYENGSLLLQGGLGWALQLAAETARRQGDGAAFQRLYAAAHQLPLTDSVPARPQILMDLAPDSFFHEWLDHPYPDDYWHSLKPNLGQVDLPMLHIGGWFDPYLRGNIRLYQQMKHQTTQPQHLRIGPWGHIPWGRRVGAVDFGPTADSPIDQLQIRWFDQVLKGKDTGLFLEPPVQVFTMGTNRWQACPDWPPAVSQASSQFYLTSSGLAGMVQADGGLLNPASPAMPDGVDVLVHDPWRPVPSLGGHAGIPAGPFDRSAIDCRSDVLTYTTSGLTAALEVAGDGLLRLYCRADALSFDISAILSEVYADGRVMNLTQGQLRVHPPQEEPADAIHTIEVPLQSTCFTLPRGHALRLSVAAACFPAYAVNPGTGETSGHSQWVDHRIITLEVFHGETYPSHLCLPVVSRGLWA